MKTSRNAICLIVASLALATGLGFAAGRWARPVGPADADGAQDRIQGLTAENTRLTATVTNLSAKFQRMNDEFAELSRVDVADYVRLQGEEAQFAKAKEILGKLFLILLHDLLYQAPKDQVAFAERAAGQHGAGVAAVAGESSEAAPGGKELIPAGTGAKQEGAPADAGKPAAAADWAKAEKDLPALTKEKANAFLDATVINDLGHELKGDRAFTGDDARIAHMQGLFSGDVTFIDPKQRPWRMELELRAEVDGGLIKGAQHVRLYKDGQKFSDNDDSGSLANSVFNPTSDTQAIILRLGEGGKYFQVYYLDGQDMLIGNYYEMLATGTATRKGRVTLSR